MQPCDPIDSMFSNAGLPPQDTQVYAAFCSHLPALNLRRLLGLDYERVEKHPQKVVWNQLQEKISGKCLLLLPARQPLCSHTPFVPHDPVQRPIREALHRHGKVKANAADFEKEKVPR